MGPQLLADILRTINKQACQNVATYQLLDLLRARALELKTHVLDPFLSLLLLWKVILGSVYLLSAGAPVAGAFSSHGPDQTGNPGRAPAQPQEYQRRNPPELPDGHHRPFRLGQVFARVRHHLR